MKRYSLIHIPAWSFFSADLYRDVCHRWKGTGLGYLLLLLAICWIAPIVHLHSQLSEFVDKQVPEVASQVPVLTFKDGKVSIDEPEPYYITLPGTNMNLVVIDTTGGITSLEEAKAFGLISETQATFRNSEVETRTVSFRDFEDFVLTQDIINGWVAAVRRFAAPICYVFAVLGSFVGRIVQVLIYAAIGMLFASWCKSRRTYLQLLRLAAVAVTPCIIIKTILHAAEVHPPSAGVWYLLCALGFLFFGVWAAAQEEIPTGEPAPPPTPPEG